ncbi:MAG: RNA polymerase sigma factor RpoD/SigA [Bacteroidetes bacterium]|nr:RNA polymerase sigma factor RpoD/SigA [Bacteroidota bacterium]
MRQLIINKSITRRDTASFEKYLHDISKVDLLTAEEEIELAQKIKRGNEEALQKLVNANLRFVVSVAKNYQHRGLSLQDLVNEGNMGLIRAAKLFDETRGFKFISYAVWWIRQSILVAIAEHSRMVRLPVNKISTLNKINKASAEFEQEHDRIPTESELADILEMPEGKLKLNIRSNRKHVSMDAPVGEDDNKSLADLMEDKQASTPEQPLMHESLKKEIKRIINTLPDNEQAVIRGFYGLNGQPMTLLEISHQMNISRERVRQLRNKALRNLRKPSRTNLLREYLSS